MLGWWNRRKKRIADLEGLVECQRDLARVRDETALVLREHVAILESRIAEYDAREQARIAALEKMAAVHHAACAIRTRYISKYNGLVALDGVPCEVADRIARSSPIVSAGLALADLVLADSSLATGQYGDAVLALAPLVHQGSAIGRAVDGVLIDVALGDEDEVIEE